MTDTHTGSPNPSLPPTAPKQFSPQVSLKPSHASSSIHHTPSPTHNYSPRPPPLKISAHPLLLHPPGCTTILSGGLPPLPGIPSHTGLSVRATPNSQLLSLTSDYSFFLRPRLAQATLQFPSCHTITDTLNGGGHPPLSFPGRQLSGLPALRLVHPGRGQEGKK